MTPSQLRRMLGVQRRSTVWRYLTGERIPQPQTLQRIQDLTDQEVVLEDFLDPSPPRCARTITGADGCHRMVLPWSPDYPDEDPTAANDQGPLSLPVLRALDVLGARAQFTRTGVFLLDGRSSDVRRIVRTANEVLRRRGEPTIAYPGVEDPS
ncbi:MAG: hypothetical protein NCW75_04155 [Phycisphaera sp.]|nr:MAG: hypothetical protein NCW75_04155 [Phycisphaera sp.]